MDNREEYKRKKKEKVLVPGEGFGSATIPWKKTVAEAWKEIDARTSKDRVINDQGAETIKMRMGLWHYSAAAVIIILFGLTSFMRFYSRSYSTLSGETVVISLPDGSSASLNAGTSVKYNPLWWNISRKISLEGEAFFEVEKGEVFDVVSQAGHTVVMGTSFNVLSRSSTYEVTCVSGKVMVVAAGTGEEVILTPNQKAILGDSGELSVDSEADVSVSTAWRRGEFYFSSVPLEDVFSEIELRYGISISYVKKGELSYTGYFKANNDVEMVLNLVCIPFGIKFEKTSENVYRIFKDELPE